MDETNASDGRLKCAEAAAFVAGQKSVPAIPADVREALTKANLAMALCSGSCHVGAPDIVAILAKYPEEKP